MGEEQGQEEEEEEEEREEVHMAVHRMAVPMASRASEEVLKHIIDFYLMLKADGYEVRQIHSDRAAEFISPKLERWCRERDILYRPGLREQNPSPMVAPKERCKRSSQE